MMENCFESDSSDIQQYFAGTTIFITGGTGFIGKLLAEKLLRTCSGLKKIYILVRPKKDMSSEMRFEDYFNDPLYDILKQSKSLKKLSLIVGDCTLPNLGMSDNDVQTIITEVNCIFHIAATVRFVEKLRVATYINVRATWDILNIAKSAHKLKSFVHVSTAFSFCPRKTIDEVFYEPAIKAEELITIVNALNDDQLTAMTPILLKEWPNTYAFTKAIAEDLVKRQGANLPLAVVRPSIVIPTAKEPLPGWINNYHGATGLSLGVFLGAIRTMQYITDCVSDQVPADYVVSHIIAVAWSVGSNRNVIPNEKIYKAQDIPIYNYVSGAQNPITYGQTIAYGKKHIPNLPTIHMQWHDFFIGTSNTRMFLFFHCILHLFPAYILDFLLTVSGKKEGRSNTYTKLKFIVDTSYFTTQTWKFRNANTQALWKQLGETDKQLFEFDIALLDWYSYYATFIYGIRIYLLKDPLETLKNAKTKALKLKVAHYIIVLAFIYIISRFFLYLVYVLVCTLF